MRLKTDTAIIREIFFKPAHVILLCRARAKNKEALIGKFSNREVAD